MTEILLVPHGGSKNDTICTVEFKKDWTNPENESQYDMWG